MLIKDKIYIDLKKEQVPKTVLDILTYDNPEYYAKMNMGLGVWKIPKVVKTFEIVDSTLKILRGEFSKVRPFVKQFPIETSHPQHEAVDIEYVNNDFELDNLQEAAVQAILSKKQGIVHAVTSAGKSLIILKAICERKLPALIIVHRKILMQQFINDIKKYVKTKEGKDITLGILGDGSCTFGPITVAIDKTAAKHIKEIKEKFGVTFLDECHLAPAQTISWLLNSINSEYRFGVTGTLKRKDQKEFLIYATFGSVIYKISKEQLLEKGRITPVEVQILESSTKFNYPEALNLYGMTKAYQLMEKTLSLCPDRNKLILQLVAKLPGKTMVLSKLVNPCYVLSARLKNEYDLESGIITGKDADEAVKSYEAMKFGDLRIIFATIGCVSTGVSISDLDNIVLISPLYTNELLLHQIRGRLFRASPGKEKGYLYFIYDPYVIEQRKLNMFLAIMNS